MMKKLLLSTMIISFSLINTYGQTIGYSNNLHQLNTSYGWIKLGPGNANWAHIKTDRERFYLEKPVGFGHGILGSYSTNDLKLTTGMTSTTNGATRLTILNSNGNVGIGTINPKSKLHVYNGNSGGNPHSYSGLTVEDSARSMISILTPNDKIGYYGFADSDDDFVGGIQYNHSNNSMVFRVNNHSTGDMIIHNDGDVSIGAASSTSGYKLSVDGHIIAEGVKILTQTAWPDYVFSKNYKLNTLEETESFIKEEGHLPNIPSASEVEENGINLGEMNAKLLEKVEELTLHLIDQNKKMEKMKTDFQKRLEALESK